MEGQTHLLTIILDVIGGMDFFNAIQNFPCVHQNSYNFLVLLAVVKKSQAIGTTILSSSC